LPRDLPLPLLTTTVVSPGASVVSVGASAAFIVDRKNRQARKSPFCEFGLQFQGNKAHHNKSHCSYHLPHLLGALQRPRLLQMPGPLSIHGANVKRMGRYTVFVGYFGGSKRSCQLGIFTPVQIYILMNGYML
jgi:hypothetical protein